MQPAHHNARHDSPEAAQAAKRYRPMSDTAHPVKAVLRASWGEGEATTAKTFRGREAQTLALLAAVGPNGVTSGDASPLGWARRTSHYVYQLRRAGLEITTTRETLSDGSTVGRYALATPVRLHEREGC